MAHHNIGLEWRDLYAGFEPITRYTTHPLMLSSPSLNTLSHCNVLHNDMLLRAFRAYYQLQAIPTKSSIFAKILFRALRSGLEIKVGCNMKSSENFLFNEQAQKHLHFVKNDSNAFWNFWKILHAFWKILHAFWNILEHSTVKVVKVLTEVLSPPLYMHSATFWKMPWTNSGDFIFQYFFAAELWS